MKIKRFKLNALSKESLRQKEMSAIVGRPLVHKAKKEYMKSIIPIILCLVFFLSKGWVLEAQPKAAYCPIPNRSVGKIKVIDSTMVKIWYAFNADNINDENTYIDKQCLDIGKKVMKYYSDILSKEDNLLLAWKKKHPKTQGIPRNIVKGGKKRETWSEYQYSELFIYKNKMEVYATMPQ